jgi:hypothetical protein
MPDVPKNTNGRDRPGHELNGTIWVQVKRAETYFHSTFITS